MLHDDKDENLLVVAAVEEYSRRHKMPTSEVMELFRKNGITAMIREHYDVLHTQGLYESCSFAEDVLKRLVQ